MNMRHAFDVTLALGLLVCTASAAHAFDLSSPSTVYIGSINGKNQARIRNSNGRCSVISLGDYNWMVGSPGDDFVVFVSDAREFCGAVLQAPTHGFTMKIRLGAGNDSFLNTADYSEGPISCAEVEGGPGDDFLLQDGCIMDGEDGNDTIFGGDDGNYFGGPGNDYFCIDSTERASQLWGEGGRDTHAGGGAYEELTVEVRDPNPCSFL